MKKMKDKVIRLRVDWFKELKDLQDPELNQQYLDMLSKLRCGRSMSSRRCAYNVLRKKYSTTTTTELWSKLHEMQ